MTENYYKHLLTDDEEEEAFKVISQAVATLSNRTLVTSTHRVVC
jgi:hypothetical protein